MMSLPVWLPGPCSFCGSLSLVPCSFEGSLSRGESLYGGYLCPGGLCTGGSLSGQGNPLTETPIWWRMGSTYPTGMHSCFKVNFRIDMVDLCDGNDFCCELLYWVYILSNIKIDLFERRNCGYPTIIVDVDVHVVKTRNESKHRFDPAETRWRLQHQHWRFDIMAISWIWW